MFIIVNKIFYYFLIFTSFFVFFGYQELAFSQQKNGSNNIQEGIKLEKDPETGFIIADGFPIVKANCTACHSAKLVIQNRMSRETWLATIRWMQETQGLWEFPPKTEETILDYLSTYYFPEKRKKRRR